MTADGEVRIANACSNPDLFWALKGGGGGFGVVTRVTVRTHALPEFFGGTFVTVRATSDDAYRRLVAKTVEFYAEVLFNPHWGEQILFRPVRVVEISMVFQGLDQHEAEAVWRPFLDWVVGFAAGLRHRIPADNRRGAGSTSLGPVLSQPLSGACRRRRSPGAPPDNIFWAGNLGEAGRVWHTDQSAWLPASLLEADRRESLVDALVAAAKQWELSLDFKKGLAGAPPKRSPRPGYGYEPGGRGSFRAGDAAPAGLPPIPAFPAMNRTRRPRAGRRRGQ